jgi:hypothetical protein
VVPLLVVFHDRDGRGRGLFRRPVRPIIASTT